jgi:hypothetical protein
MRQPAARGLTGRASLPPEGLTGRAGLPPEIDVQARYERLAVTHAITLAALPTLSIGFIDNPLRHPACRPGRMENRPPNLEFHDHEEPGDASLRFSGPNAAPALVAAARKPPRLIAQP